MPRKTHRTHGVFCIEGDWWNESHHQASVRPALELLSNWSPYYVPFMHWTVCTLDSFDYQLSRWSQKKHAKYPILYFALHGEQGQLRVGDFRNRHSHISLKHIETQLEDSCKGRIILFGSCQTLKINGNRIHSFLRKTGALAVCGYDQEVDWLYATAFEAKVLGAAQDKSMTLHGADKMKREIESAWPDEVRQFGFRMYLAGSTPPGRKRAGKRRRR